MKPITFQCNSDDENVILHLPINPDEVDNDNDINTVLEYNPSIDEPLPYEPIYNYGIVNKETCIDQSIYERIDKLQNQIYEQQISVDKSNDNIDNDVINNDDDEDTNNNNNNCDSDEDEHVDQYAEKVLVRRKLTNIMFEFIDTNNRHVWPKSTNIYCQWCCHPFDNLPCAIPDKYINGKFYLFGCFCSFNCAAAYNFNQKSYSIWERFSLLNLLYKKISKKSFIKIKQAPPRQTLKIFGGFFTIEQFRKNFLTNIVYNIIDPPMIAIIPKVEENIFEHVKKDSKFIPVDDNMIQNATLKLKREKPLTNTSNTLESYMNLKIV